MSKGTKDFPEVLRRTRQHSRGDRQKDKDTRFREPAFRRAVWQVLEYLGEEPIFGNFKKHDRLIDWEAFARHINHLTRAVLCHVLDGQGQKVAIEGTPVVVAALGLPTFQKKFGFPESLLWTFAAVLGVWAT